jgi:hypothetical protein
MIKSSKVRADTLSRASMDTTREPTPYLAVRGKADYFAVPLTEDVPEFYRCRRWEPRTPGTGYRGDHLRGRRIRGGRYISGGARRRQTHNPSAHNRRTASFCSCHHGTRRRRSP